MEYTKCALTQTKDGVTRTLYPSTTTDVITLTNDLNGKKLKTWIDEVNGFVDTYAGGKYGFDLKKPAESLEDLGSIAHVLDNRSSTGGDVIRAQLNVLVYNILELKRSVKEIQDIIEAQNIGKVTNKITTVINDNGTWDMQVEKMSVVSTTTDEDGNQYATLHVPDEYFTATPAGDGTYNIDIHTNPVATASETDEDTPAVASLDPEVEEVPVAAVEPTEETVTEETTDELVNEEEPTVMPGVDEEPGVM